MAPLPETLPGLPSPLGKGVVTAVRPIFPCWPSAEPHTPWAALHCNQSNPIICTVHGVWLILGRLFAQFLFSTHCSSVFEILGCDR